MTYYRIKCKACGWETVLQQPNKGKNKCPTPCFGKRFTYKKLKITLGWQMQRTGKCKAVKKSGEIS